MYLVCFHLQPGSENEWKRDLFLLRLCGRAKITEGKKDVPVLIPHRADEFPVLFFNLLPAGEGSTYRMTGSLKHKHDKTRQEIVE